MDNYYDTSLRMYNSSKTLHIFDDYHNSCYLAGYVIECYAKIILGLHYNIDAIQLRRNYSHKLDIMDTQFNYIVASSSYSEYMVDMILDFPNITTGSQRWDPIKRYINHPNQWTDINSKDYQNEMEVAMEKIAKMKVDGFNLI